MRAGKLFALAAVEVDIDGVAIEIHGVRAMHVPPAATRIEVPTYRDAAGRARAAIILPEEVRGPMGDAVLDRLVELGLAVRRAKPAEIRRLLRGDLDPGRTRELLDEMRAAGLPT